MRRTRVSPSATRPARTSAAEARRSEAVTGAPSRRVGPAHDAPCARRRGRRRRGARARRRAGSGSRRSSPTIRDVPCACVMRARNCACRSVGKPGCGAVAMSAAASGPRRGTRIASAAGLDLGARAAEGVEERRRGRAARARVTVTSPPVIAPAARYVPASIRSGTTACGASPVPPSRSTPSTVIVDVPAPETRAPMRRRRRATSSTSGSRAAFSITVVPRARAAAKRTFSVPVTVGVGKADRRSREAPARGRDARDVRVDVPLLDGDRAPPSPRAP